MKQRIKLVRAVQKPQIKNIRSLYRQAFPREERKPFFLIRRKCREGVAEMLAIESEAGEFLGLAITMLDRDIALLDYFAIVPNRRAGGVGSAAFALLQKRYEKKRFILEIESTDEACVRGADAGEILKQRRRRKNFYLKNGMGQLPYLVKVFGVEMEMLACGCEVGFAEYRGVYEHSYGRLAGGKIHFVRAAEGCTGKRQKKTGVS